MEIRQLLKTLDEIMAHPSISKRDAILRVLNPFLAETADEISGQLGVDYVNMVTGARLVSPQATKRPRARRRNQGRCIHVDR